MAVDGGDREAGVTNEPDDEALAAGLQTASTDARLRLRSAVGAVQRASAPLVEWRPGSKPADGAVTAGFPDYHPAVSELLEALEQAHAVAIFDWTTWQGERRYPRPSDLGGAPVADAVRLLTTLIRRDRFVDGTIASAIHDGRLLAAAERILDAWRPRDAHRQATESPQ